MKKVSILCVVVAVVALAACNTRPKAELKTSADSLAYALGMSQGQQLDMYFSQQGITDPKLKGEWLKGYYAGAAKGYLEGAGSAADKAYRQGLQIGQMVGTQWYNQLTQQITGQDSVAAFMLKNLIAGFVAGGTNDTTHMSVASATAFYNGRLEDIRDAYSQKANAEWISRNEQWLTDNKTKEGVQTTASGLQYKVLTKGEGALPTDADKVKVMYEGKDVTGAVFDSSYARPDSATTFGVTQVIAGWTEALKMMPVGSEWEVYIPQDLAYGSRAQSAIKPYSTLIFKVKLLEIEAPAAATAK
jgi:FKBP-type peptidyl-prolyl cis-trans isomerase FklB